MKDRNVVKKLCINIIQRIRFSVNKSIVETTMGTLAHCGYYSVADGISVKGPQFISIGQNFRAGKFLRLEALESHEGIKFAPSLILGDNVSIEDYCHIGCNNSITIGDNVLIASKVFITDHSHGTILSEDLTCVPSKRPLISQPVSIGDNCWLGDGVCILPGVVLGSNVIVGANAVVTHSFPSNVVIAGCPARVLKTLE